MSKHFDYSRVLEQKFIDLKQETLDCIRQLFQEKELCGISLTNFADAIYDKCYLHTYIDDVYTELEIKSICYLDNTLMVSSDSMDKNYTISEYQALSQRIDSEPYNWETNFELDPSDIIDIYTTLAEVLEN